MRQRHTIALILGLALVGSLSIVLVTTPLASASRLSDLIKEPPTLYFPARLVVGETGKLIVKAPAGHTVVVVFGPPARIKQGEALITTNGAETTAVTTATTSMYATRPDGQPLKVSADCQTLELVANEKGVAVFPITVPDAPQLAGQTMVIDGYTIAPDGTTVEGLAWVDPMGRSTQRNEVVMDTLTNGNGAMITPGLPGIGAGMARQLGTLRDINNGGERMKDLVDDGSRGNSMLDRNSFIKRVDGVGSAN